MWLGTESSSPTEGRHLNDIKVGLQSNMAAQWYLQSEAEHLVADRTGHEVQARLQVSVAQRALQNSVRCTHSPKGEEEEEEEEGGRDDGQVLLLHTQSNNLL